MNPPRHCWQRRWIRGFAWTLLSLAALMALLWAWVDWSGARRWREAQAMLAREGQTLDLRAMASDPIPDAGNFCAIPLLKDLSVVIDDNEQGGLPGENRTQLRAMFEHFFPTYAAVGPPPQMPHMALCRRADLEQWAAWFRKGHAPNTVREAALLREKHSPVSTGNAARDVLLEFSTDDPVFRDLALGLNRPEAQWTPALKTRSLPPEPDSTRIPHLITAQLLNFSLPLRCAAAARTGDVAQAHESAQIIARLTLACLDESILGGLNEAESGATDLVNATWVLCDTQTGDVEDFRRLESALSGMDFRRAAWRAMSGNLICAVDDLQVIKESPSQRFASFSSRRIRNAFAYTLPSGFFDAAAAVVADREFEYFIKPLRDRGWQAALVSGWRFEATFPMAELSILPHPSLFLIECFTCEGAYLIESALYTQTLVNQAAIGCALERYRIENGSYPDSLDVVKLANGKPLPANILTGTPMGYRKTANGKYALWSTSLNSKDHGGRRAPDMAKPHSLSFHKRAYQGDWVWDFPVTE